VIVARHCGLRVAVVSAITNMAVGMSAEPVAHGEVLKMAAQAATSLVPLARAFVRTFAEG